MTLSEQYQDFNLEQLDGLVYDGICEYTALTVKTGQFSFHEQFIFDDGSMIEFFHERLKKLK